MPPNQRMQLMREFVRPQRGAFGRMIFHSQVMAPSSFRPDHQTGRVLAHVERELERRRETVEGRGDCLVLEGVSNPGWHARFSGRGVLAYERQPAPGRFTIRVSVVREALASSTVFAAAAVLTWISGRPGRYAMILAAFAVGISALWAGWGLYKVVLLRRLVNRALTQVAA